VKLANACYLCHTEEDLDYLAGDVDAAPDDVVKLIASSDHWSREQWQWLVQRFAPRPIDLVRRREADIDYTLRVLGPLYGDLGSWPDNERRATEEALHGALIDALEHWPTHDLVRMLGGLGSVYDDLWPWLARVDAAIGPAARAGVVRLAFHWSMDLLWQEDNWFSWWYPDDPVALVREWTLNARPVVDEYGREHPTCKTARDTLTAIGCVERGENGPWPYPHHHGPFEQKILN
jgi:hypothetical protein